MKSEAEIKKRLRLLKFELRRLIKRTNTPEKRDIGLVVSLLATRKSIEEQITLLEWILDKN